MIFGQSLHSEDLNSFHFGLYSDWKVEKKSTEGHIVIKNHQEGWGGFIEPPLKTAVQVGNRKPRGVKSHLIGHQNNKILIMTFTS